MTEREALELEDALSQRYPGGAVTVTAQRDGAKVVIESAGESSRYSLGDAPSALLGYLLARHAD